MIPVISTDERTLARMERLAVVAGEKIMTFFRGAVEVRVKDDASFVTEADHASEAIILAGLKEYFPGVPCISEEAVFSSSFAGELGKVFFLVDPLDGTKEFIQGRKDFTVNIALIKDSEPVHGVIYVPATRMLYAGRPGSACVARLEEGSEDRISMRTRPCSEAPVVAISRSHMTHETVDFLARFPNATTVSIGSSLKFCLVACGDAEVYPRFGRTMEWDTAAGDAILRAAGGRVLTMDGQPLRYGKRTERGDVDFANPSFVAVAGAGLPTTYPE
jgi:3'(2'), 5'-bisphosphate nucleotidase